MYQTKTKSAIDEEIEFEKKEAILAKIKQEKEAAKLQTIRIEIECVKAEAELDRLKNESNIILLNLKLICKMQLITNKSSTL